MLNIYIFIFNVLLSGKLSVIHSYKEPKDTISKLKELSPVLLDSIQATEEIKLDTVLTIAYGACYENVRSMILHYIIRAWSFILEIKTRIDLVNGGPSNQYGRRKIIENMIVHNDIGNLSDYYPTDKNDDSWFSSLPNIF